MTEYNFDFTLLNHATENSLHKIITVIVKEMQKDYKYSKRRGYQDSFHSRKVKEWLQIYKKFFDTIKLNLTDEQRNKKVLELEWYG